MAWTVSGGYVVWTSILRIGRSTGRVSLLAATAQGKLGERISDLSGLSAVLTRGKAERLLLGVSTVEGDGNWFRYDLALSPRGNSYTVESESLGRSPEAHRLQSKCPSRQSGYGESQLATCRANAPGLSNRHAHKKTIDALRILHGEDLAVAARECSELKALLNTLLTLCGAAAIS